MVSRKIVGSFIFLELMVVLLLLLLGSKNWFLVIAGTTWVYFGTNSMLKVYLPILKKQFGKYFRPFLMAGSSAFFLLLVFLVLCCIILGQSVEKLIIMLFLFAGGVKPVREIFE